MIQDNFIRRKNDVLAKRDRSSIGRVDDRIIKLCDKINKLKNYYTTSSCSGRILLMISQDKKAEGLFIKMHHDNVSLSELKKDIKEIIANKKLSGKRIKFKQEPCILHVACRTLEDANVIYNKAKEAGWKNSGIIGIGKTQYVVEMNSTEKIDFPIINKGKILVDDNFLKIVLKDANDNMKKCWEKIRKLENSIKD